jgi:hypothetical protein
VSDPFDGDPDDVFEPEESETEYGADQFDTSDPAASYEEGTFDTSPSVPEAPTPENPTDVDYSDVDPELRTLFWKLVVVVKLTLLTLTLGVLLITLGDSPSLGWQLLAAGAVLIFYGVYQYRQSKARIDDEDFDPIQPDSDADGDQPSEAADPGRSNPDQPAGGDS